MLTVKHGLTCEQAAAGFSGISHYPAVRFGADVKRPGYPDAEH